jgi:hypothetical protein
LFDLIIFFYILVDQKELKELQNVYEVLMNESFSKDGLDFDAFNKIMNLVIPVWSNNETFYKHLFNAFDKNKDRCIKFKDLAFGLSTICKGTVIYSKNTFIFNLVLMSLV